jgi:peptidoglycan/LPS O-acetylase OafA/YrhL
LPSIAFALIGVSLRGGAVRRPWPALLAGAIIALLSFEGGLPIVRRAVHLAPALRPIARATFHVGVVVALASASFALARKPTLSWLGRLGRRSLPIYWVHVTVVFGFWTAPMHDALSPAVIALALCATLFTAGAAFRGGRARLSGLAADVDSSSNPRA